MFQPEKDQIPSQYDLMPPTIEAIYQLVDGSEKWVIHYTCVDEQVTEWITDMMPSVPVDYITPEGSRPLLEVRLAKARSLLYKEGLIKKGDVPGWIRGFWGLTPKALDLRDQRLRSGGRGAAPVIQDRPTMIVRMPKYTADRLRRFRRLQSGSQSSSPSQSQGLDHANAEIDMNLWIDVLQENNREFTVEKVRGPDGTVSERIIVKRKR